MALLTVQPRDQDPVFQAAAAAGDSFYNDGKTELLIKNDSAGPIVVTFPAQQRCSQGQLDDLVETVAPNELFRAGPFQGSRFNDGSAITRVQYASVANLSVAAARQVLE